MLRNIYFNIEIMTRCSCVIQRKQFCAACSWADTICPARCTWWLEQPIRAFSFEVTAHSVMWSSYSIRIPSLKFVGFTVPKIWLIFRGGVNRPGNLSISKWGHRLFPAKFQLPMPFRFRLKVRHGTDRQSDRTAVNALCPSLWGRGHIKPTKLLA